MPRYSSYKPLDDRVREDGDRGFVGFNNRLRPDQLESGILADSQNGRLGTNGEWQVRRGIDSLTSPVAVSAQALHLPFNLDDSGTQPELNDGAVNQLYGSCPFSNPNVSSSEVDHYIIMATNSKAFAVNVATELSYEIGYESSQTISSSVHMLQTFNKVLIFRGDSVTMENALSVGPITAISKGGTNNCDLTVTTSHNHYLETGNKATITGASSSTVADTLINKTHTITKVDATSFKFTITGTTDPGTLTLNNAGFATPFDKVASGTYTQPVPIDVTDCDISNGVATCTASSGDVGQLVVGDTITVSVPDTSPFTLNQEFTIASIPTATSFTIITDKADQTNKAFLCTLPQSVAGGYSHMPASEFGHYHQRRLVLPYKNSVDASTDSYTYRNIQDELIFSDILDSNTYDPIYNQFRFNAGKADRIMGLHSFSEDILMVFNRNSIHLVSGTSVIKEATNKLLTDEIGLIARDTIQQIGNQILFLSDNGVYGVGFIEDYKLRGTEVPLSESIQSTINRLNTIYADKAQSVYFDNRYYLAIPLDQSSRNNAIIVYNFLNKQWESIDTVNDTEFHITNMFVAGEGGSRGVYVTNDIGGIHRIEHRVDGDDQVITAIGGTETSIAIQGSATTRQFTLGTLDRKKWKSFEMHVESSPDNESNFDISAECENLDRTVSLGSLNSLNNGSNLAEAEDISIRGRMGNPRAYGVQFVINNTVGRPRLRAVKTDGIESFRTVEKAV